jgi:hypothetical protein
MVVVVDSRGHLLMRMGRRGGGNQLGDFRFPTQAVIEGDELYVLDAGNTRVQIFDPAGRFRRAIQLASADQNTGLAVDGGRNVYVSDPVLKLVQVFGREGRALYTLDLSTTQTGEFSRPASLWVSADDCLYLVDSVRRQVGVFQITRNNARQCDQVWVLKKSRRLAG